MKDVALTFEKALIQPLASGAALTCNIGTGKAMSILVLKRTLDACFPNWTADTHFVPARPGDIKDSRADISQTKIYLDFEPQFSTQEGLLVLKQSLSRREKTRDCKVPVEPAVGGSVEKVAEMVIK